MPHLLFAGLVKAAITPVKETGADNGPRGGPGGGRSGEEAGGGGADEDRGPGAEGAPGVGQGAELVGGGGLGEVVEVGGQGEDAGLVDREDVGEAAAADDDQGAVERADALDGLELGHGGVGALVLEGGDVEAALEGGPGHAVQPLDLVGADAGEGRDPEQLAGGGERGQARG